MVNGSRDKSEAGAVDMTNQTPESVIAEAMVNAGAPLMHSRVEEGVASALRAANMLREPGVPDAATEELARIKPLFENLSREYPNECNKRVKAEVERDAAIAGIERVRAIIKTHVDYQLNREAKFGRTGTDCICEQCQILAALDGAPEPDTITIPRPVVPFGPVSKTENEATADYLLEVVKKIDGKYCTVGGSNVTAAVRKLLTDAADAVRGLPVEGESE